MADRKNTFKDNALRVVAVLGLLAILLLGAWGIIQIAFFISSLFSTAGGAASNSLTEQGSHELVTLSLPTSAVAAGSPITVSWKHSGGTGNYAYELSYSCGTEGLSFKAPVPTGATQTVPCDTPFNYTQAQDHMTITPVYTGTGDATVNITVIATKLSTGVVTASASGGLTVTGKKAPGKSATAKPATTKSTSPKTTYVASPKTYAALYGYPDLAVSITSVYSQGGRATLQFTVQNVGTNVSPQGWSFVAYLPINGGYQYPSGPQRALYPGDKIVFSMGYGDYGPTTGYTYGTCNQYGPCAVPGYQGGYQPYNPYGAGAYGYNYGCSYGYGCSGYPYGSYYNTQKAVTVTVDPYNQTIDPNRSNNTATANYVSY